MTPHGPRDRTTIRRALAAGGIVWALCVALWIALGVGGTRRLDQLPLWLALGAPFAGITASLWLWLGTLLDVLAGEPPSTRRWIVAVCLTLGTAFVLPVILRVAFTV